MVYPYRKERLPSIKIKGDTIYFNDIMHKTKASLQIVDLQKKKFKLNGYSFQYVPESSNFRGPVEMKEYFQRIMRSHKNAELIDLMFPKAQAYIFLGSVLLLFAVLSTVIAFDQPSEAAILAREITNDSFDKDTLKLSITCKSNVDVGKLLKHGFGSAPKEHNTIVVVAKDRRGKTTYLLQKNNKYGRKGSRDVQPESWYLGRLSGDEYNCKNHNKCHLRRIHIRRLTKDYGRLGVIASIAKKCCDKDNRDECTKEVNNKNTSIDTKALQNTFDRNAK